ncbi:HpcH/HpaI aldolase/citrate lyase family protein [Streptomyces yatensis]|nr:aldolase/citrate lyase family protein [Streptomyces yatensis]
MNLGRTLLFSPGDHARRVERALASPAATVVLDLEDGVAEGAAKEAARATIARALSSTRRTGLFVRVNGTGSPEQAADLAVLAPVLGHVTGIVVPKVESGKEVAQLGERLHEIERDLGIEPGSLLVVPVVETCAGLLAAPGIAAAPRVAALILGVLDLAAELGVSPVAGSGGLDHVRVHLAVAARAARLPAPADGPHPDLEDDEGLRRSSLASRALGFGGRVVLHPRQLEAVERAYAPTADEVLRARRVVEAAAAGAGSLRLPDGTFVDEPVIAWARAVLAETGEVTREHAPA